jgi:hypothetical protein
MSYHFVAELVSCTLFDADFFSSSLKEMMGLNGLRSHLGSSYSRQRTLCFLCMSWESQKELLIWKIDKPKIWKCRFHFCFAPGET